MLEHQNLSGFVMYALRGGPDIYYLKGELPKLYKTGKAAQKVADKLDGYTVVPFRVCEIATKMLEPVADKSGIVETLKDLVGVVDDQDTVVYKCSVSSYGGSNVIRHTPLGEMPVHEKGDKYVDYTVELKFRNTY